MATVPKLNLRGVLAAALQRVLYNRRLHFTSPPSPFIEHPHFFHLFIHCLPIETWAVAADGPSLNSSPDESRRGPAGSTLQQRKAPI